VTAEELKAVGAAAQELLGQYRQYRKAARTDAPADARTVFAMFRGFPA
jgi:hypothetical protein